MSKCEKLYTYLEKLAEFISSTNSISSLIMRLHLEEVQTEERTPVKFVLNEYDRFKKLVEQAKEDGISEDRIFLNQVQVINNVFAYFADTIPELEELT